MLIFSPNQIKYIWYSSQKSKFYFYFILNGKNRKHNLTLSLVDTRTIWLFQCFSNYNIGCKQSLHLENGSESYFNEWNIRISILKKVLWVCLGIDVTCKLALHQTKQWRHYVWCWRHNMRSAISHKYPSRKTFWKKYTSPKIAQNALLCCSENINRISH